MTKRTHSQDRGITGFGSPTLALQAASATELGPLIQHAQHLDRLDQLLRQSLPSPLAGQCRLANANRDKLVFMVNSPIWKNRLRLEANVLLDAAAAAGFPARELVVKVAPTSPTPSGVSIGKPLSEATRHSLRATAQSVTDPDLRAQLLKLASLP